MLVMTYIISLGETPGCSLHVAKPDPLCYMDVHNI